MDIVATRAGIRIHADAGRVAALREEFAQRNVVRLPRFLAPDLLERARREIDAGTFVPREDAGIALELHLPESRAFDLLDFVMNAAELFAFVRDVTSCASIGGFTGRIYRFDPRAPHHDSWHDDTGGGKGDRLVGFSLNLGRDAFRGGVFQLRRKDVPEEVTEIANTGAGDAFLFRIGMDFEHRVTSVEGEHAKTAFAGWFRAGVFDPYALFAKPGT